MNRRDLARLAEKAKPTAIDRLIAWHNPERGLRRQRARLAMAFASAYSGANLSRRTMSGWTTTRGDADSDIIADLPTLRRRSADLERNNPIARGAINTKVAHTIGVGLTPRPSIDRKILGLSEDRADEIEESQKREFALWAESAESDHAKTLNFYQRQALLLRNMLVRGDCLSIMVDSGNGPYSLAEQLVEADRISNPGNARDTSTLCAGIERTESGQPIACHVARGHPGSSIAGYRQSQTWDRIPFFSKNGRRNAIHLFRQQRIAQTRGVPDLATVIEPLRQLGDYSDAALTQAVVAGLFTAFVTSEGSGLASMQPTSETGAKSTDDDFKMGAGAILDLAPGESVSFANPGIPNAQFGPFVQAMAEQIGAGLELPYELLMMHFTASFSASRAAILMAWAFFVQLRTYFISIYCSEIRAAWMDEAVASGRLVQPGYFSDPLIRFAYQQCTWNGPAMPEIDQVKAVTAAEKMEDRGYKTAQQATAELTGGDWEQNIAQIGKEQRRRADNKVQNETQQN